MPGKIKPLDLVIRGVDRVTEPVRRINRRIESMRRPVQRVALAFRDLTREAGLSRVATSVRGVGREIGALARRAALFGSVLAGAAAAGVKRFIDTGDRIAKTADSIGIGIEALQEYRFAADRSGVAQDKLDRSLQRFSRTLGETRAGSGTLVTILKKTSPALLKQLQAAKSSEEGLQVVFRAMGQLKTQADRAALANAAFGRSGIELTNMLKEGVPGLEALRQEARDLGIVMSEEAARSAEVAQDRLTNLMSVVKGIAFAVGSELLPEISQTIADLTDWARANRDVVRVRVVEFARSLAEGFRQLRDFLVRTVPPTLRVIEAIGGFKTIAGIAAAIVGAKLIVSLVSLGSALVGVAVRLPGLIAGLRTLNLAFLLSPIGLWIAGIAAVIAIGVLLVRHWDTVKTFFVALWKRVSESPLKYFIPGIGPVLAAVDLIKKTWQPLVDFFSGTTRSIARKISALVDFLPGPVAQFLGIEDRGETSRKAVAPGRSGEGSARRSVAPTPPAAGSRISGELAVNVSTAPGLVSRVTRVQSSRELDLTADLGPSMVY